MGLKITDSIGTIKNGLYAAMVSKIDPDMRKKISLVERAVKNEIKQALLESPAIQSLSGGILKADFGLTQDPTSAIVDSIVETTRVEYVTLKNKKGGFKITVQPITYGNLYSLGVSRQDIEGGSLPWLNWLLEAGDTILIVDFGVEYGLHGRTGMAHMTSGSRPFKVNSSFSGTTGDNFVTRAIQVKQSEINNAIIKAIL